MKRRTLVKAIAAAVCAPSAVVAGVNQVVVEAESNPQMQAYAACTTTLMWPAMSDDGVMELFYRGCDGKVIQLTKDGATT